MSLFRTIAPTRTAPSGRSVISVSGRGLMSTTADGCSTCSFIRSMSVVPPARNRARAPASMAECSSVAVMNSNGRMRSASIPAHGLDDRHDALVRTAPADVAAHALPHVLVGGPAVFAEECHRRHDLAGRAVAALKCVVFNECLLYRMQLIPFGQSLDRRHMFAGDGGGQRQTRQHAAAFDVNRARSALAVIASFLRARQLKVLTKRIEQRDARIDPQLYVAAVYGERDFAGALRTRPCVGGADG